MFPNRLLLCLLLACLCPCQAQGEEDTETIVLRDKLRSILKWYAFENPNGFRILTDADKAAPAEYQNRVRCLVVFALAHCFDDEGRPLVVANGTTAAQNTAIAYLVAGKNRIGLAYTTSLNAISAHRIYPHVAVADKPKLQEAINKYASLLPKYWKKNADGSMSYRYTSQGTYLFDLSVMQFLALAYHETQLSGTPSFWQLVKSDLETGFFETLSTATPNTNVKAAHAARKYSTNGISSPIQHLNRTLAAMATYYLACENGSVAELTQCNKPHFRTSDFPSSLDRVLFSTLYDLQSQNFDAASQPIDLLRELDAPWHSVHVPYGFYAFERFAEYTEMATYPTRGQGYLDWYSRLLPRIRSALEPILKKQPETLGKLDWYKICFASLFLEKSAPDRVAMRQLSQWDHGGHFHLQAMKKVNRDCKDGGFSPKSTRPLSIYSQDLDIELARCPVHILTADEFPGELSSKHVVESLRRYFAQGGVLVIENSADKEKGPSGEAKHETFRRLASDWLKNRFSVRLNYSSQPVNVATAYELVDKVPGGAVDNSGQFLWGVARTHGLRPNVYYFDLPVTCLCDKFCSADAWKARGGLGGLKALGLEANRQLALQPAHFHVFSEA